MIYIVLFSIHVNTTSISKGQYHIQNHIKITLWGKYGWVFCEFFFSFYYFFFFCLRSVYSVQCCLWFISRIYILDYSFGFYLTFIYNKVRIFCRPRINGGVPCCCVRYDFRIQMMFGLSLPLFVCRKAHVLFTLFVFVCRMFMSYLCYLCLFVGCSCLIYVICVCL